MNGAGTLLDRIRITDVVANLAHAQDTKDWELFRALFADRMTLDLTGRSGEPAEELTADEMTEKARTIIDGFACTHHASSNLLIEVSGTTARCRAHMVAYHHVPTPGSTISPCGAIGSWTWSTRTGNG